MSLAAARPPQIRREPVPFLDLGRIHAPLKASIVADIAHLIEASAFTNGPAVGAFERAFRTWCGAEHCVGVASGLDALRLALLALGVGPGDEVIVPAGTFAATVEAVIQVGAAPVLVDAESGGHGMDPLGTAAAVTSRTRCLLPVHLHGHMADVAHLLRLATRNGLSLLEDACQAHGARRDGLVAGTAGHAGAFSFYPGKNLGAMGDAGALVCEDARVADDARARRQHGQRHKHQHDVLGYTARLDTLQALVLLRKLEHVDAWNTERRRLAAAYTERLAGVGDLRLPDPPAGSEPVWHVYAVRTGDPDGLAAYLEDAGIATGRHYPRPVHLCRAYRHLGPPGRFPVAEAVARETLSLPLFPGLREDELEAVVEGIGSWFAHA